MDGPRQTRSRQDPAASAAPRPSAGSRRAAPVAAALVLSMALAGCSAQSMQYGKLAQATGTAYSAAKSAAYALALHGLGEATGPVTDTGLTDAMANLESSASSLTGMTLTGAPRKARDDLLQHVRAAQDAVLRAQATLATHPESATTGAKRALNQAAEALSHRESDLKAKE